MKPNLRIIVPLMALFAAAMKGADDVPPTVIESTSLEMRSTDAEITAVFDQNVVVTGNNLRISCDHLEVIATRIGDATETVGKPDKFKSLVAVGRVHIIQGDREVTCGRAEVFPGEEKIILTENPVVIDKSGPYVASGTRIVLLRGERRLFGDNIKMTGPGLKDLGFDKEAPMKSPAPVPGDRK
ncbi:MAG: hypothetical protein KAX37_05830 [Opitutaceae bacterium]|nr:hypothetical protein [Opitutaceae bacterium]